MIEKKGKQMIGLNKSRWVSGNYVHKTYYFRLFIFNWVFFSFFRVRPSIKKNNPNKNIDNTYEREALCYIIRRDVVRATLSNIFNIKSITFKCDASYLQRWCMYV